MSARDVALEHFAVEPQLEAHAASHVDERQLLKGRKAARMTKYLQHAPARMAYGVQNRRGSVDTIGGQRAA
jgi:hypothetical protein